MLNSNMVHLLGSDVHRPGTIYWNIEEAKNKIAKIVGETKLEELTTINPRKILKNEVMDIDEPIKVKKRLVLEKKKTIQNNESSFLAINFICSNKIMCRKNLVYKFYKQVSLSNILNFIENKKKKFIIVKGEKFYNMQETKTMNLMTKYFPKHIKEVLENNISEEEVNIIEEIRIRINLPIIVKLAEKEKIIDYKVSTEDINYIFQKNMRKLHLCISKPNSKWVCYNKRWK